MKKMIIVGLCMFLGGSVLASVFYLHVDMPTSSTPNDQTLWFNDPVGGVTQQSLGLPTSGNRFDLNGKLLRSATTTGSHTFAGTFVVSANSATGLLYAANWNIYGMDVSKSMLMRAAGAYANTVTISNLVMGSSGLMEFRTLTNVNNKVNLSVDNISGSGIISFGLKSTAFVNDENGIWSLATGTTTNFNGIINLARGQLTFSNSFALANATLALSNAPNSVVLANNVTFGKLTYGATTLTNGSYTATELNTLLGTTRFSGSGILAIPEPATIGMLGIGALITLLVRRIRTRT